MNIYVASPYQVPKSVADLWEDFNYSDRDELISWRTRAVLQATAKLQFAAWQVALPYFFYTPIGYESVLIDRVSTDLSQEQLTEYRGSVDYWMDVDRSIFKAMDQIVIVGLPGWTQSTGVIEEAKHFHDLKKDVLLLVGTKDLPAQTTSVTNMNEILAEVERDFPYVQDDNACWDAIDIVDILEGWE